MSSDVPSTFVKPIPIQSYFPQMSNLILGCMTMGGGWNREAITAQTVKQAQDALESALSVGINTFDHADIYAQGKAEETFGKVLKHSPGLRDQMFIQSKCGIRLANPEHGIPGMYDFSPEHIRNQVEGSLKRLQTDHLDLLLLHRPDPLIEPEEVATVLDALHREGKIRHVGVSNMNAHQIRFLQQALRLPLIVNQLQMSLAHLDWLDHGVQVNHSYGASNTFDPGMIEFCRTASIQLQAWSPLAKGIFSGPVAIESEDESATGQTATQVARLAAEKQTTPEAIVLGWLMKHPAGIQPVIGTLNPQRIRACADAGKQAGFMSREEWYTLYVSARGKRLP